MKDGLIAKIKDLVFGDENKTEELEAVHVKTEDGKILQVEEIAVDQAIVEIDEAGEEVVLDDETYLLDDGRSLVIEGGMIKEIIEAETEDEDGDEGASGTETEEMSKADKFKALKSAFDNYEGVSAYMELPVGVHTIADKVYTVIEVTEEEGTEWEWTYNVIESIVPVEGAETAEEMSVENMSVEDKEVIEKLITEFSTMKDTVEKMTEENTKLKEEVEAFAKAPSATETETKPTYKEKFEKTSVLNNIANKK